jgi:hypothetical protein
LLKGITEHLIWAGVKYQETYGKDIGFPQIDENEDE